MKIIVGLGNPGTNYAHTRHNVGFDTVDELAKRQQISLWKMNFQSFIAPITQGGEKILLLKPMTYMNNSGEAVGAVIRYYKITPIDIYVICDDLDLPPGKIRIRKKGSSGGHNGLKSIIAHLGTEGFVRFRIGVGHPQNGHTVIEHVLGRPYEEERRLVEGAVFRAADAIEFALSVGIDGAMNKFNQASK